MVHRGVSDHSECGVCDPLPKDDVFVVDMRLDLLLRLDVEDLECPGS